MSSTNSASSPLPLPPSATVLSLTKVCGPPRLNPLVTPDQQSSYEIVPQRLTLDRRLSTLRGDPQYRNHTHTDFYLCPANGGSDAYNRFLQKQSQRVYDVEFNYGTSNLMNERIPQVEWNPMVKWAESLLRQAGGITQFEIHKSVRSREMGVNKDFREFFNKRFLRFLKKHNYTPEEASYFTDKYRSARDDLRNLEKDLKDKMIKDDKRKSDWGVLQQDKSLDLRVREVIDKVHRKREYFLNLPAEDWTSSSGNLMHNAIAQTKSTPPQESYQKEETRREVFDSKLNAYIPHFQRLWNISNAEYQKYLPAYERYRDLALPECKLLAAEFEELWTNKEPLGAYPVSVSSSQHGYTDFYFMKRLLSIAQVIHGLRPSKRNELLFENRDASATKVPGYHSVEFVGRLAEVEVYAKFIHHIGLSVRVARKRGYLNCKMITSLEGDFTAVNEVVRILGPGCLRRGAEDLTERDNQRRIIKAAQNDVDKKQGIKNDKVEDAIGTNLNGFRNMIRNYSGSRRDKQCVHESLGIDSKLAEYVYRDRKRPVADISGGEEPIVSRFKTAKQQRDFEQSEDGDDESVEKDSMEFQWDVPQQGTEVSQEWKVTPEQQTVIDG